MYGAHPQTPPRQLRRWKNVVESGVNKSVNVITPEGASPGLHCAVFTSRNRPVVQG